MVMCLLCFSFLLLRGCHYCKVLEEAIKKCFHTCGSVSSSVYPIHHTSHTLPLQTLFQLFLSTFKIQDMILVVLFVSTVQLQSLIDTHKKISIQMTIHPLCTTHYQHANCITIFFKYTKPILLIMWKVMCGHIIKSIKWWIVRDVFLYN